jgi:Ca2+-binding EF-hand superfamily protein
LNEKPITFDQFVNFLNERLGDNSSRLGLNSVFSKLMDPKVKEITPKALHNIVSDLGHELSLDDIKYLLERVSEPSTDINITSDEFYYIMTKKPADVDLITPVTKSTK